MNPIDQMMQAYGNSPSEALAGLLGISPGVQQGGVDADELAAQFAQALETAQQTGDISAALPGLSDEAARELNLSNLTPEQIAEAQAQLFASLGVEATDAAGIATGPLPSLEIQSLDKGEVSETVQTYSAGVTLVSYEGLDSEIFAQLQSAGFSFNEAGVAVVPLSELEALGLKLEQLPALPTGEQLAAVGQAPLPDSSRIIQPTTLQTALTQQPQSADATSQAGTALPDNPDAVEDLLLGEDMSKQVAAAKAENSASSPNAEQSATDGAKQTVSDAVAASQSLKTAQEAADQAKQQEEAADAEQAAQAQAEGHGATTVAAQQAAGKKADGTGQRTTASGAPQTNTVGDGKDAIKLAAKTDGEAAASSAKEALTHQAVDPARAKADTQPAQHTTAMSKEPQPQWTPERLAGLPDSASALASGLTGLKGESSPMNSMGLLGGRASPEIGHQVGQQLNASVTKAVKDGQQEFTVRLNPSELGRVQVKLNFLEGGRVQAQVMAERPETLELLQRDTRGLERALEAGGSKADGGIEFSLEDKEGQSAGKSFAEAMQQEKMREQLDSGAGGGEAGPADYEEMMQEEIPLEEILSQVTVETGLDVRV